MDLRGNQDTGRKTMLAMGNSAWIIMIVIGIVMLGYSVMKGETRSDFSQVNNITINVVATGESIPMSEEETAKFLENFDKKPMYKRTEKDAPLKNYAATLTLGEMTLYVSIDQMVLETPEQDYTMSLTPDQWTSMRELLGGHDVTL